MCLHGREWKRKEGEGVKGFLLLKRGGKKGQQRGRGMGEVGEGGPAAGGGSCSKVAGG